MSARVVPWAGVVMAAVLGCEAGDGGGASVTLHLTTSGPGAVSLAVVAPGATTEASCEDVCDVEVPSGATVTATALPDAGARLLAWDGACSGAGACTFALTADAALEATFEAFPPPPPGQRALEVRRVGTGAGRVTSSPTGVDCGTVCRAEFADGTRVTLTAAAEAGSTFGGWSGGGCSGTDACEVTLGADATVTATFTAAPPPPPPPGKNALSVAKAGDGAGRVTSSPAGIDCGTACSAEFDDGTTVTLSAAPDAGSTFSGWSGGGCSGTGACVVTLDEDAAVTATFAEVPPPPPPPPPPPEEHALAVQRAGAGTGTVTSNPAGLDCGATCVAQFEEGTNVTLTAAPAEGSTFSGWSGGGCSGAAATCEVTLAADTTVTATFAEVPPPPPPEEHTLTIDRGGEGAGTVTSAPAGIDCGATCATDFEEGTAVTLTAAPEPDSLFSGWSGGGCSGTSATCELTLSGDVTVTATFAEAIEAAYGLTEVSVPGGTVIPLGLNARGDVAGAFTPGAGDPATRPFLWDAARRRGALLAEEGPPARAVAVNDAGTVVIEAEDGTISRWASGRVEPLEPVAGARATDVSPDGRIVGWLTRDGGDVRGFVNDAAGEPLRLLEPLEGAEDALAHAIDAAGVIVGESGGRAVRLGDAAAEDLGVPPRAVARDLTEGGRVVGTGDDRGKEARGFVLELEGRGLTWADPPDGFLRVDLRSANDAGVAVGTALEREGGRSVAVRFDGTRVELLGALIEDPGWPLEAAVAVNGRGQVLVAGVDGDGRPRAAVLTPR